MFGRLRTSVLVTLVAVVVASGLLVDGPGPEVQRSFYPNGALRWERSYSDGTEEGLHRGWYADGSVHFVYNYVDGRLDGLASEWFPNGRQYRAFNYAAGQESGHQQMWHEDGSLRANYVVREGRRYGLMGAKGCVGDSADSDRYPSQGASRS